MQIAYIPRDEHILHEAAPTQDQQAVQSNIADRTRELVEQYQDRQAESGLEVQELPPPVDFEATDEPVAMPAELPFGTEVAQVAPVMPGELPDSGAEPFFLLLIIAMVGIGVFAGKILSKL